MTHLSQQIKNPPATCLGNLIDIFASLPRLVQNFSFLYGFLGNYMFDTNVKMYISVTNCQLEPARANESMPKPLRQYIKCLNRLSKRANFLCQLVYHMTYLTKHKRKLIRLSIISFDLSRAIQSHQSQVEPTRVMNGHHECAKAHKSKQETPIQYMKSPE